MLDGLGLQEGPVVVDKSEGPILRSHLCPLSLEIVLPTYLVLFLTCPYWMDWDSRRPVVEGMPEAHILR